MRAGKHGAFEMFVQDAFVDGNVARIQLAPEDVPRLVEALHTFGLDFDDAYQYTAAEKFDLQIVSFDTDFDRTDRGRKTPAEVMAAE